MSVWTPQTWQTGVWLEPATPPSINQPSGTYNKEPKRIAKTITTRLPPELLRLLFGG